MADPFIGEIRLFAFGFAPLRWAVCDGQLLPISQHTALYSLIGTTYGGNGTTHFAVPDLRGRTALGQGPGFPLGLSGGEAAHVLTVAEMPGHTHQAIASSDPANTVLPTGRVWARAENLAYTDSGGIPMSGAALSSTGGNQPHNNMQPFLVGNYCIALEGIFPPRPDT
ncbi:phage tail protein [Paenibacillus flagellatus]|uniref:Phage tail protein n=1 Tax=Paenibacillus flagellatus TaxID=2211139 RepID=A0A2V5KJT4_9BACL|nr:tail fiber protein [Paenibacillus flagellatus]PYI50737.1 phage tail protein [Paenibacillus flagellatus]